MSTVTVTLSVTAHNSVVDYLNSRGYTVDAFSLQVEEAVRTEFNALSYGVFLTISERIVKAIFSSEEDAVWFKLAIGCDTPGLML